MTMKTLQSAILILAFLSWPFLTGCSTFNRDWKAITLEPAPPPAPPPASPPAPAPGMEGRWKGIWHSDTSGHDGELRCIIARLDDQSLHARYRAKYGGFLTFEYDMDMSVRQEGDTYQFAAQADLGWLAGGLYEYTGTVRGDTFEAIYTSKGDNGTFRMQRVKSDPP